MASDIDFTDDEIREELAHLGYFNVPQEKLEDFKRDLITLISSERSKTNSLNSSSLTNTDTEENRQNNHPIAESPPSECSPEDFGLHQAGKRREKAAFREDWQYKGEHSAAARPRTAPARSSNRKGALRTATSESSDCGASSAAEHSAHPSVFERNQSNCEEYDPVGFDFSKKFMKRKTSRKTSDGCRLIDESFSTETDSEAAGIYEIYEKIKNLAVRECECGKSRPKSGDEEPPYRIKGKNNNPSVIKKRDNEPPHTRNLKRTDRNERLQMYMKAWKTQPAIGENHRHFLRKSVRAKLMNQFVVEHAHKVFVPNMYTPPHEKDRVNLRWEVRRAVKNYEMPIHGFYHEV